MTATTLRCEPAVAITRSLLGYGAVAGPFYVCVSLAQALTRDGFDLSRHPWSVLENGPLGWIQSANFVLTGAMVGRVRGRPAPGAAPARGGRRSCWPCSAATAGRRRRLQRRPGGRLPGRHARPPDRELARHAAPARRRGRLPVPDRRLPRARRGGSPAAGRPRAGRWRPGSPAIAFLAAFAGITTGSHGRRRCRSSPASCWPRLAHRAGRPPVHAPPDHPALRRIPRCAT